MDDLKTKIAEALHAVNPIGDGQVSWEGLDGRIQAEFEVDAQAALQAIHDAGYDLMPRDIEEQYANIAEQAFCEGWRDREARPGQIINSRAAMRQAWIDSNARDLIQASQPNTKET